MFVYYVIDNEIALSKLQIAPTNWYPAVIIAPQFDFLSEHLDALLHFAEVRIATSRKTFVLVDSS